MSNTMNLSFKNEKIFIDPLWIFHSITEGFNIKFLYKTNLTFHIELIGVDSSIVNSLRRIIISEIATISINELYLFNNSSILNDDILSHRLGLVPLKVDPHSFKFYQANKRKNERNTLILFLKSKNLSFKKYSKKIVSNLFLVYTKSLKWSAYGSIIPNQSNTFFEKYQHLLNYKDFIIFKDIIITKLKPRQHLSLEAHATKGYGLSHAKYSPVSSVWFFTYNTAFMIKNIYYFNKKAYFRKKLQPIKKLMNRKTYKKTYNLIVHKNFIKKYSDLIHHLTLHEKTINYLRDKHFIFNMESIGVLKPEYIFFEGITILNKKFKRIKTLI